MSRRIRVLALHGFRTNAAILRKQLRPLIDSLPDDKYEFVCVDAPNPATGDPDEAVKLGFPSDCKSVFEWYGFRPVDEHGKVYDYTNFDVTIRYLLNILLASEYDILLGFSQGGCLALTLTWMCEQGLLRELPSHKRWKAVVALNAPFSRNPKYAVRENLCTSTLLVFGAKDKVIDPSPWQILTNALRVVTDEAHALPRLPTSVSAVSSSFRKLTARRYWFAFDFDGVVCDSARETGITAWRACHGVIPGADGSSPPPDDLLSKFCEARPLLETGFEALVIMYRLAVLKQHPQDMLASESSMLDMDQATQAMGISKEELKERFQKARDDWIAQDTDSWMKQNRFYLPIVRSIIELQRRGVSVYVITTKHASFATRLLSGAGISLPTERIFGLGSGPKRKVIETLSREREAAGGGSCIFIEDRVETLRDVAANCQAPTTLILAGHGYNTIRDQSIARNEGFFVSETAEELEQQIISMASVNE